MKPSLFASAQWYGRKNHALTGSPTESRVDPVPIVGFGLPWSLRPSEATLLLLCEPERVRSHVRRGMFSNVLVMVSSRPEFATDARFFTMLVFAGPADGAIGCEMIASFVLLL